MSLYAGLLSRCGFKSASSGEPSASQQAINVCIDALCELLTESARDVENSAVSISTNFRALADMTKTQGEMIEKFGATVGRLSHKGGSIALQEFIAMMGQQINAPIERMETLSDKAKKLAVSTDAMFKRVGEIEAFVRQVHGINNKIRMLTYNAAIEAGRAGKEGLGFAVVANEIKQISFGINDMANNVKRELTALNETLHTGQDALNDIGSIDVSNDSIVRDDIHALMQSLAHQNGAILQVLQQSAKMAHEVSAQVGRLTVNIQFQDRNTQLIHSVISILQGLKTLPRQHADILTAIEQLIGNVPLSHVRNRVMALATQRGVTLSTSSVAPLPPIAANAQDEIELF